MLMGTMSWAAETHNAEAEDFIFSLQEKKSWVQTKEDTVKYKNISKSKSGIQSQSVTLQWWGKNTENLKLEEEKLR